MKNLATAIKGPGGYANEKLSNEPHMSLIPRFGNAEDRGGRLRQIHSPRSLTQERSVCTENGFSAWEF